MTHSWMAALLVTVPPCPLCNPGNPRQGGALLVLACCARQRCRSECGWWDWHGTSTPVRLQRWRSRWGFGPVPSPCWALPTYLPTSQPTNADTHSLGPCVCGWASSAWAENRSFPQIRPLDPQHWVGPRMQTDVLLQQQVWVWVAEEVERSSSSANADCPTASQLPLELAPKTYLLLTKCICNCR